MCLPYERIYAKSKHHSRFPIRWGIWRGVWICSTPICHKATGLCSDRLPLVQCGIICIQKVCASGILCIQQVGIMWRQMQQRVNPILPDWSRRLCWCTWKENGIRFVCFLTHLILDVFLRIDFEVHSTDVRSNHVNPSFSGGLDLKPKNHASDLNLNFLLNLEP